MLILEQAINRYLALDPEINGKLAAFDGKVIKLEITGLGKNKQSRSLFLFPSNNGIQVKQAYHGAVDTILRGSPLALFKMGLSTNAANLLLKGEVEITGDSRSGHQFKAIFDQMDIDWAEPLASIIGDEMAYQLLKSGEQLARWAKETASSFTMSVSEYLQEESRDVVTEAEQEIYCNAVDTLREDTDRLQAKIQRIIAASQEGLS